MDEGIIDVKEGFPEIDEEAVQKMERVMQEKKEDMEQKRRRQRRGQRGVISPVLPLAASLGPALISSIGAAASQAKVKKLEVSINGKTTSTRPFEPDFTNDLYLRSYLSLYQGLVKFGADWAPDIILGEYENGYTLWCIDFTKDQEAQLDFHLIETGNLRIEIQFAANTTETLKFLVYAEFDNLLEIDKQFQNDI
uniref:Uncharacterized protein n=1 Tax=Magallana gigas TaxID=29159 RepID=K1Q9R9_MAGGI